MEVNSLEYGHRDDVEEYIKAEFKKTYSIFQQVNFPNGKDSLMCSIHSLFDESAHNCIGCNLNDSALLIDGFLEKYQQFDAPELVYPIYILLLYLMVERIDEYLNIIGLHNSIKARYFQNFSLIRKWANFFKHPKAFMLVHHPYYIIEGFEVLSDQDINIDDTFVDKYYSGGGKNKDLYNKLTNKDNVVVVLPKPTRVMKDFCEVQTYFLKLLSENQVLRELLDEKATKYYEDIDKKLDS